MTEAETEPRAERKPFAAALQEMRKGGLHTEMSDELAALVQRVMETGKKGSITLTLTVDPVDDQTAKVTDKIAVKTPRFDTAATTYFPDEHGNLNRNRPDQPELPLREIEGGKSDKSDKSVETLREAGGES